jgi:hypothetical protein
MREEPIFQRPEIEDETRHHDGSIVNLGDFDDALAFGWA